VDPHRIRPCLNCDRRSPHAILGVEPGASTEEVTAAAREKIKTAHPDRGGSTEAFQRVKEARDRLLESDS
jgi:curved DNA-binding protein CbpA